MKVLVTGATGFVGSHTVAELVRLGHQVRVLARKPERVRPALEPLGVADVEVAVGDVTDGSTVERAIAGCDAIFHCAGIYSLDPRMSAQTHETNVRGTELVLDLAHQHGLDPIVHVSSVAAFFEGTDRVFSPSTSPSTPSVAYARSKADSDRVARRYQDQGAPVVITYPSVIAGPHDPHYGETCQMIEGCLRGFWSISPVGGTPITDVRDLARLHGAILEPGRGPRRYMATAHWVPIPELVAVVGRVTGRRLSTVALPPWMLLGPMRVLDAVQHLLPTRLPLSHQLVHGGTVARPVDDSATRREFGIVPRDLEETIADTIVWMVEKGHISARLAGRLGSGKSPAATG